VFVHLPASQLGTHSAQAIIVHIVAAHSPRPRALAATTSST